MKIAIISDIHDNVWNLQKALSHASLQATDALLCCGDLCAPFIVKLLGQGYEKPIHIVLGNNDGDLASIIKVASGFAHIEIHGDYFHGEVGGKDIGMNHYPDKARVLAESGTFDIVCYGHNHELSTDETVNHTLLVNPGAIMGYHGGQLKDIQPTFVVLDCDRLKTEVHQL